MNWAYHRTQPSYGQRQSASPRSKPAYARSQRAQNMVRLLSEVDVDLVASALDLTKETLRSLANDSGDWDSCTPLIRERLYMAGLPRNWFERTDASLRPENIKSLTILASESVNKAPTRRNNFKKVVHHFDDNIELLADALEVTAKSLYGISDGSLVFDDERFGHLNPKLVKAGFPDGWVDMPDAQIRDEWFQGLESLATDQYEEAFESEAHGVPVSIAPMADDKSDVCAKDSAIPESDFSATQEPTEVITEAPTEPALEALGQEPSPVVQEVSSNDTWPSLSDYSVNLPSLRENSQNSSYLDPEDIRNYTNPLLLKPLDRIDQLGIRVTRPVAQSTGVVHRLPGNPIESIMSQPTEANSWYEAQKPKKLDMVSLDEVSSTATLSSVNADASSAVAVVSSPVDDTPDNDTNQSAEDQGTRVISVSNESEAADQDTDTPDTQNIAPPESAIGRGFASKLNLAKNAPISRNVRLNDDEADSAPAIATTMEAEVSTSHITTNTAARKGGRRMGASTDVTRARVAALEQLLEPSRRGARATLWRYFLGKSLSHWTNLKTGNTSFRDELARQVEVALELPNGWLDNPVMPPPTIAAWLFDANVPLPGADEKQNLDTAVRPEAVEPINQKLDTARLTASQEEQAPATQQGDTAALNAATEQLEPVIQTADTVAVAIPAAINEENSVKVTTDVPASVQDTPVGYLQTEPVEASAAGDFMEPTLLERHNTIDEVVLDVPAIADGQSITLTWSPCAKPTVRSQASPAVQALKQLLESLGQSGTFTDADAYRFLIALTPKS